MVWDVASLEVVKTARGSWRFEQDSALSVASYRGPRGEWVAVRFDHAEAMTRFMAGLKLRDPEALQFELRCTQGLKPPRQTFMI